MEVHDGKVLVPFTIANETDADALEGSIHLRLCDGCTFSATPQGFNKFDGESNSERNLDFQHVFAGTNLPPMEVSVVPPPGVTAFKIGIYYRCRTCDQIKLGSEPPQNDVGTVQLIR